MPPQNLSLSMMRFEPGPMMSIDEVSTGDANEIVCSQRAPVEIDMILSLVAEPTPIVLDDYRPQGSARLAG